MDEVFYVIKFGNDKYGFESWVDYPNHKFLAALMRHIGKFFEGKETVDPETGYSHMAHAIANIIIMYRKMQ